MNDLGEKLFDGSFSGCQMGFRVDTRRAKIDLKKPCENFHKHIQAPTRHG
jgi:hypothetical protein